jgi:serine/threonine protein kinase
METSRFCPQCRQPLASDAPEGLCPQCLLNAAAGPLPSGAGVGLPDDLIDIADPAEVAKKLPQFEILALLGRGGMGVVYKARQVQLDRIVALKILPPVDALSPDFVARFTREARALGKLNHPNIVAVHDFGETNGLYFIVMEYVDGANLRQLQHERALSPAEALPSFRRSARPSSTRTRKGSCTGTSSRRTCSSTPKAA